MRTSVIDKFGKQRCVFGQQLDILVPNRYCKNLFPLLHLHEGQVERKTDRQVGTLNVASKNVFGMYILSRKTGQRIETLSNYISALTCILIDRDIYIYICRYD